MCQRVMIAMALLCDPELLIADEPTTGLDVTIQAQVLELFAKLVHDFRSTALLITHDLGVVAETCDRVAVMYAGTIVEQGATADVFGAPRHPYTQGLLAASVIDEGPINYIRGGVPDLVNRPPGCTFADRCYAAEDVCRERSPALEPREADHGVACHAAHAVREGTAWPSYHAPRTPSGDGSHW
jgi:peptide/nickel transport system ATP-binding protein